MFKSLSKLLFMITILVAFLGQAMSYHVMAPHDDVSSVQSAALQHTFEYHDDGSKASDDDDDCCEVECCESECICPENACASFVFIDTNIPLSESVILSEPMLSFETKSTHFIATSLYRPPILPHRA
jgi:hypothetical protein